MATTISMGPDGLTVPDDPIIPFIEGDGIGPDIWAAAQRVFDAAVDKAYAGTKAIEWMEVLAGEKAFNDSGEWLPDETVGAFETYLVGIKGPLTTPVGGGIRSLNVALRQKLDLYACVRPVRWFDGVPSPVRQPELVDMVIFRENTEDVYAGKELEEGTEDVRDLLDFLQERYSWDIRPDSGIGIKPVSITGSKRLIRAAINYALQNGRKSVTLVHKGNIMKFTEGAFRTWGYELVKDEFSDAAISWEDSGGDAGEKILVQDVIADAMLQQVLTRPANYDVIATTNLNGLVVALIAIGGGVVIGVPLGVVQAGMHRAQGSTDLSHDELKGRIGIVQLPTHPDLAGRVEIPVPNGGTVTLPARGGTFKVGDRVKIVDIVASTAFIEAP